MQDQEVNRSHVQIRILQRGLNHLQISKGLFSVLQLQWPLSSRITLFWTILKQFKRYIKGPLHPESHYSVAAGLSRSTRESD